jgi:hypothetical protein
MNVPGVCEETVMRYKVNSSAAMTDTSLVRARGVSRRRGASPLLSMVRDSSVTVVSGDSRIPFERSSRIRRFPWRCRSSIMMEHGMAMRKREDEVYPNAAGIDVGGSSHWVAVPQHLADAAGQAAVREVGRMTDDLGELARWLLKLGVDTVALESTGVYWTAVFEVLEQHSLSVWLVDARQLKYVPGRKSDVQDLAAKAHEPGAAARGLAPRCRGLRGAGGGAPARSARCRADQLGAAHAKSAGADEYPAHRGPERRDGPERASHHPRHRRWPA